MTPTTIPSPTKARGWGEVVDPTAGTSLAKGPPRGVMVSRVLALEDDGLSQLTQRRAGNTASTGARSEGQVVVHLMHTTSAADAAEAPAVRASWS